MKDLDDLKPDVSFSNVMDYIGESSRMIREGVSSYLIRISNLFNVKFLGEEVYKAKHIIHCGVKQNKDVVAMCLRSSTPNEIPHEIHLIISGTVEN